ncbi:beta-ketoacyl-[acyl-carrier-protein] synthase family protein [Streptomyces sp. NPDC058874]|uniref:beta-ketoacyl-[acyl-carrier-protein] synthase family protein n=1 Tax=unclassified Streptomyces TaxID=2593676 RepID=UPI0036988C36
MRADAIAVTGIGLVTPAGLTVQDNWSALCQGRSLATRDPRLSGLPSDFSCQVPAFDAAAMFGRSRARRLDRFGHFALIAARAAVMDSQLDSRTWNGERVGVVLGTASNSMQNYNGEFSQLLDGHPARVSPLALPRSLPDTASGEVALDLGAKGPSFATAAACASGAVALSTARDLLRAGACDIVLAGGSESPLAPMTVACFAQMGAISRRRDQPHLACRPFDADRDGLVLGEGAAVLVLERHITAKARCAPIKALLRGCGTTTDAHHPVAPHPTGDGAARALRIALQDSGCSPRDIGHINAHGTSTRHNDGAEAAAFTDIFGSNLPPVTAPKSIIGHAIGAAGAIEAAYTVLALQHQQVPPTANFEVQDGPHKLDIVTGTPRPVAANTAITCSFGFGGRNSVLLLTTP